jgi:hypothetical protein
METQLLNPALKRTKRACFRDGGADGSYCSEHLSVILVVHHFDD